MKKTTLLIASLVMFTNCLFPQIPDQVSDPFLMTGFDQKVVHLINQGEEELRFTIEVDVLGNDEWSTDKSARVTVQFVYT